MRIYKPKYRNKEGNLTELQNWWVEFYWKRRRCRLPGLASHKQTEAFGRRLEELISTVVSGQTPDASLMKWMQAQTPETQRKLASMGLLEGRFAAAGRPLREHLEEWKQVLLAKGNTPYHAERYFMDATRIVRLAKATYMADLQASAVQGALEILRTGHGNSNGHSLQTLNHSLRAIKAFTHWLVTDRRATDDPLTHMRGFNVRTDRRHDRRALSDEEVAWLLQTVESGKPKAGICPADRAMLYRVALGTGFRRGELASLTPSSFHLDQVPPTIIIQAAYSKHRREDTQPIRPDLAATLKPWLASRPANGILWPLLDRTAEMIREDLLAARSRWLQEAETIPEELSRRKESDFLAYRDRNQQVADFHALRHTFITRLVNSGASVKAAQELARHSTPVLTLGRYAHADIHDTSRALAALSGVPDESSTKFVKSSPSMEGQQAQSEPKNEND